MATATRQNFLFNSEVKVNDFEHKRKMTSNISKYNETVVEGKKQFLDIEVAREIAKNKKWTAIEQLDEHLIDFERKFTANGGKVIWAETTDQAREEILKICQHHKCQTVVKSKSMVTEEIGLNQFLKDHDVDSIETDLGEYIQQLDNEAPYHIVTPAMHKSKEDIAKLFYEKLNTEANLSPEELTLVARKNLRKKFKQAQVGITGANFLVADVGGICITENEGNARLSTAFPKVHLAIVGIEKMISSIKDLNLFWPLLSTYGTGQKQTVYNSIFTGPKQVHEVDGPEEMYVILLDNGRTKLINDPALRESAYCIRCGSCLNVCPVYQNIGGHTYDSTYSGPIGAVITPHLENFKEKSHLSHASTLCGSCTDACPVNINIHGMLHYNRTLSQSNNATENNEKWAWRIWRLAMRKRSLLDMAGPSIKTKVVKKMFGTEWDNGHTPLKFKKSFKQLYKKSKK
jgi:L-lactate dehydrogenase complex protein LldF